ncbi:hypothetical protein SAMN04488040_1077 [Sulfitobacter marinus]|uniref:Uncharacterized protein n=1 Tax=Sulfitobacter marinus TaxID=394264 RepID=A0A1I6QYN7_9RHOB|nr:hypothetical protein SAMN04488040_1077 [Sulfitobacter marinus]
MIARMGQLSMPRWCDCNQTRENTPNGSQFPATSPFQFLLEAVGRIK